MFMILLDLNLCEEPNVLTCVLFFKYLLTVVKIIVPILLMYSCISKLLVSVFNGEPISKHIASIFKSTVAAVFVFLIPTLLNSILMELTDYDKNSYGLCVTNANLPKIKELRKKQLESIESYDIELNPNSNRKPYDHFSSNSGNEPVVSENPTPSPSVNVGGDWSQSVFPLPSSSTSCRSSVFGPRIHPITGQYNDHSGDDYPAACGTSVYAVLGGTVVSAANDGGWHGGMGNYVKIQHTDGTFSVYMHSSNVLVSTGQVVSRGEEIMKVGTTGSSTGCHLHITIKNSSGNNVAPENYIPTLPAC